MIKKIEGDKYANFKELKANEKEGFDYEICKRFISSAVAIIAPHGGKIEPGTSEIAEGIAGIEYNYYSFKGLKNEAGANRDLHITSSNFDEPIAVEIVEKSEIVVAIHGCAGEEAFLELGGLNDKLKILIEQELVKYFEIKTPKISRNGEHKRNICNRSKTGCGGIQIEISKALRDSMFNPNTIRGRLLTPKENFGKFISAVRTAIYKLISK